MNLDKKRDLLYVADEAAGGVVGFSTSSSSSISRGQKYAALLVRYWLQQQPL
jgi:hypothetical protein